MFVYQIEKWQVNPHKYPTEYQFVEIVGYDLSWDSAECWLYTLRESQYNDNPEFKFKVRKQPKQGCERDILSKILVSIGEQYA